MQIDRHTEGLKLPVENVGVEAVDISIPTTAGIFPLNCWAKFCSIQSGSASEDESARHLGQGGRHVTYPLKRTGTSELDMSSHLICSCLPNLSIEGIVHSHVINLRKPGSGTHSATVTDISTPLGRKYHVASVFKRARMRVANLKSYIHCEEFQRIEIEPFVSSYQNVFALAWLCSWEVTKLATLPSCRSWTPVSSARGLGLFFHPSYQ